MSRIHDDAIVLARHDYSETSQVLMLLTRQHGKVRAIAKGVKRGTKTRFAVGIDLLDIGFVNLSSRPGRTEGLSTITEWKQTRGLTRLRTKLFRIYAAQYSADITARLLEEGDPHPEVFDSFLSLLDRVSEAPDPFESLFAYQSALLDATGSRPRFDSCVRCGSEKDLSFFSSFEGGMVCRNCAGHLTERHRVSDATFRLCQCRAPFGLHDEENASGFTNNDELHPFLGPFRLLNYHLSHMMGRESTLANKLIRPTQSLLSDSEDS